jgi:hypothetical protein
MSLWDNFLKDITTEFNNRELNREEFNYAAL